MRAPKTERLNLRISGDDDALLRRAADLADESLTDFVVRSAREAAQRHLADRTRFVLSDEEWREFTEALDRPAALKPELVELLRRPDPFE